MLRPFLHLEARSIAYKSYMDLIPQLKKENPDVILVSTECIDDHESESTHINYTSLVKNIARKTKIIVCTPIEKNEIISQILKAGTDGYLTKDSFTVKLIKSIKEVYEEGTTLSPTIAKAIVSSFLKNTSSILTKPEIQVLKLIAKGKTYQEIATDLFLSGETIRIHIKKIFTSSSMYIQSQQP